MPILGLQLEMEHYWCWDLKTGSGLLFRCGTLSVKKERKTKRKKAPVTYMEIKFTLIHFTKGKKCIKCKI